MTLTRVKILLFRESILARFSVQKRNQVTVISRDCILARISVQEENRGIVVIFERVYSVKD